MNLNEYQARAGETAVYPGQHNSIGLAYTILGLTGEAGEVAEKLKKTWRDDGVRNGIPFAVKEAMAKELGDVLWYVSQVANELGFELERIAQINIDKLAARQASDVIHGSGDDR